jgi:DNA sulfur modification protein DndE
MALEPAFTFEEVARASFTTSVKADEINSEFAGHSRLGLRGRNYAARLALARSLAVPDMPPPCDDSGGKAIKGANLFGDDSKLWVSLIVEHFGRSNVTLQVLQDLVRRHWARGALLLDEAWNVCGEDHDRFLLHLAAQAGLREGGQAPLSSVTPRVVRTFEPRPGPVGLPIGPLSVELSSSKPVRFFLNAKGTSPHVAIMGTLGTGKTLIAKTMMKAAHQQSGCPVLVFDMGKGDLAGDEELVRALDAEVLAPPRRPVPLDIFAFNADDDVSLTKTALRFRESFARIPQGARLGDIQNSCVGEAAERALRGTSRVRLSDVHDRLREVYAERRRKDDLAITTFEDIGKFRLFEPEQSPTEFFSRSWIVDVHTLPEVAQRMVVFLILDAAYAYLTDLEDSSLDPDGNRAVRLLVCVDEARRVLAYEQASLIGLVRESRSKGGAVLLISQSPDDFSGDDEDFLENLGIGVCLRTNAKPAAINRMLGRAEDLAGLGKGVAITRLPDSGVVRVKIWNQDSNEK